MTQHPGERVDAAPLSTELLADVQAGLLDPATATAAWVRIAADPQALARWRALERTVADLHNLAPVPMPSAVAEDLSVVLAAESDRRSSEWGNSVASGQPELDGLRPRSPSTRGERGSDGAVPTLDAARRRRNTLARWGAGFAVAAAVVIAAVLVVPRLDGRVAGTPVAGA
ncbi:MAG: hypothetical protein ACRDRL_07250, partial [Sciscionella sp.]